MADRDSRPPARGDEAELFRAFNDHLVRELARAVRVLSPQVIEDACAYAWAQFLEHQPDRDLNWRGWLFRVAQRECWRLDRELGRDMPIRTGGEFEPGAFALVDPHDRYAIRDDVEDAFSILQRLPPRLRSRRADERRNRRKTCRRLRAGGARLRRDENATRCCIRMKGAARSRERLASPFAPEAVA
jgi:hypothetical protein